MLLGRRPVRVGRSANRNRARLGPNALSQAREGLRQFNIKRNRTQAHAETAPCEVTQCTTVIL